MARGPKACGHPTPTRPINSQADLRIGLQKAGRKRDALNRPDAEKTV
jgi:hypothetical protein